MSNPDCIRVCDPGGDLKSESRGLKGFIAAEPVSQILQSPIKETLQVLFSKATATFNVLSKWLLFYQRDINNKSSAQLRLAFNIDATVHRFYLRFNHIKANSFALNF